MLYQKIDAYSVMFYGWRINDIFKRLFGERYRAFEIFKSMFNFENVYKHHEVVTDSFFFMSHGLLLSIPLAAIERLEDRSLIFEEILTSIRLEMKGEALDYIRELGVDIDTKLMQPDFWEDPVFDDFEHISNASYNVTRIDLAFDFINEKGDFLDQFRSWYSSSLANGTIQYDSRLNTSVGAGGSNFTFRDGSSEKSLVIGSKGSPKILRIYDKKMECSHNGIFNDADAPQKIVDEVGHIETWIRFEVQLRRGFVKHVLYAPEGISSGWKFIEENFLVRDPSTRKVLSFFEDIYEWTKTKVFSPIFYFIQSKDSISSAKKQLQRTSQSAIAVLEIEGVRGLLRWLLKAFVSLKVDYGDDERRALAYKVKLANMMDDCDMVYSQSKWRELIDLGDTYGLIDSEFPLLRNYVQ